MIAELKGVERRPSFVRRSRHGAPFRTVVAETMVARAGAPYFTLRAKVALVRRSASQRSQRACVHYCTLRKSFPGLSQIQRRNSYKIHVIANRLTHCAHMNTSRCFTFILHHRPDPRGSCLAFADLIPVT